MREKLNDLINRMWHRVKYYRLTVFLFLVALVAYGLVANHQSQEANEAASYQVWVTQEIEWDGDEAILSIAFPETLRLESPAEQRPLSVWLWKATPTVGPTPTSARPSTCTPTPTSPPTPIPETTGGSTSTPTPTLTPTLTPTPTPTPGPWVVAFSPHDDGVLFTDQEGRPVAPQLKITPGAQSAAPVALYVQRAPLATVVPETALDVSVYGPSGFPISTSLPSLSIDLESRETARRRHRRDLLWGPTTPLLILASGLLTFGIKVWQEEREEQKRRNQEIERYRARIRHLLKLQPGEKGREYFDLVEKTKTDPDWQNPQLVQELEGASDEIDTEEILVAAGAYFSESDDERVIQCAKWVLERERSNRTALAFERASRYAQGSEEDSQFLEEPERLAEAIKQVAAECSEEGKARAQKLSKKLADQHGWSNDKRRSFAPPSSSLPWFELWPADRLDPSTRLKDWLRQVGLELNPFGPAKAELDPLLKGYGIGDVLKEIRGKRSVVAFGESGSGRTAATLLLAFYCEDPPTNPRERDAFPVHWAMSPEALCETGSHACIASATRAAAQVVLKYVAHRPDGFLDLDEPGRYGVVRLLSFWSGSRDELETELRRAGPSSGAKEKLVREVTALYQAASHGSDTGRIPDLLANALPTGFRSMYLILDLHSSSSSYSKPALARSLHPLLHLAVPLAIRGVYLKLLLPEELRSHIVGPATCEMVSLQWTDDNLADMLEARIEAAGGNDMLELCGPSVAKDPGPQLIQAARGSPGRLVQLGNALLHQAADRISKDSYGLSAELIDSVLGPLSNPDGARG